MGLMLVGEANKLELGDNGRPPGVLDDNLLRNDQRLRGTDKRLTLLLAEPRTLAARLAAPAL
jgi:hypothetical protein